MVKEYFSVDEAAQRLSTPNEHLSRRDVFDLAMRAKLRLVFWHEGELHRFRCVLGGGYADLSENDAEGWHVFAASYFLVPRWQITPVSSGFTIDDMRPVEKPAWSSRPWRTGARGYVLGAYSLENEERITHRPIHVDADSVLVPRADIGALAKKQLAGMTGPAANAAHCAPADEDSVTTTPQSPSTAPAPLPELPIPATRIGEQKQVDRVIGWIEELEKRAAKCEEALDRHSMPGQKDQFRTLLARLDSAFLKLSAATLDDYIREAGCRWPKNAKQNPSAEALYLKLFPEAPRRTPG